MFVFGFWCGIIKTNKLERRTIPCQTNWFILGKLKIFIVQKTKMWLNRSIRTRQPCLMVLVRRPLKGKACLIIRFRLLFLKNWTLRVWLLILSNVSLIQNNLTRRLQSFLWRLCFVTWLRVLSQNVSVWKKVWTWKLQLLNFTTKTMIWMIHLSMMSMWSFWILLMMSKLLISRMKHVVSTNC